MNKKIGLMCLLISLTIPSYNASELSSTEVVDFTDPNLEACVKSEISSTQNEVTISEMRTLTDLNCDSQSITSLNGIEYATNLQTLSLQNNYIIDLTELSQLVNLNYLDLSSNSITNADSLVGLTELVSLDLSKNSILDVSNLSNLSDHSSIDATHQYVTYEPITIIDPEKITYTAIGPNYIKDDLTYKPTKEGNTTFVETWNISSGQFLFSGTFSQDINYAPFKPLVAVSEASVNEEKKYSDQQLIDLFEVESNLGLTPMVDQSTVNYNSPGNYAVIFSDSQGNEISSTLTVKDVKPTISVQNQEITYDLDDDVSNYLNDISPLATEITPGDLTSEIVVDDSDVDFSHVGKYQMELKVSDEEGNTASQEVRVVITDQPKLDPTIESDDPDVKIEDGVVSVNKHSGEGVPLPGYEYTIYDEDGNVIEVITTDENGYAESSKLLAGNYYVELTGTPTQDVQSRTKAPKRGNKSTDEPVLVQTASVQLEAASTPSNQEVQVESQEESDEHIGKTESPKERVFNKVGKWIKGFGATDDGEVLDDKLDQDQKQSSTSNQTISETADTSQSTNYKTIGIVVVSGVVGVSLVLKLVVGRLNGKF